MTGLPAWRRIWLTLATSPARLWREFTAARQERSMARQKRASAAKIRAVIAQETRRLQWELHIAEIMHGSQPTSPGSNLAGQPVKEEIRWACRWVAADGRVLDETDGNEQRAHSMASRHLIGAARGEVIRYRVLTMPDEVVAVYEFPTTA